MDFEGLVLSDKKVAEAVARRCVPVVADNYHHVEMIRGGKGEASAKLKERLTEASPRNRELFDEIGRWGGGIVWVVSADGKRRAPVAEAGSVPAFLELFDKACKEVEAPPEK